MIYPDSQLLFRIKQTVDRQRLFNAGDTLIVALSGGADSTALLDLLSRLPGYSLRLVVAHLNHCLRGAESDADEEFCRVTASRYSVPFEVCRIDIGKMAADSRLNLEDAGRRARIEFLGEISEKYEASAVVLAHHADDQAETVLMRLLRGSGMTGLSGIAYRNARGYIRPLLDITRSEIEQYLRSCGLEWREDASNSDTIYLRNRIRHQLLPLLEEYNPAIRSSLSATASIITDDETLLEELTVQAFTATCTTVEGGIDCSVGQLRTLSRPLRRRVLRHAFKHAAGSLTGVSLRHIDALCDLIDSGRPNARLALPQGVSAVREYDRLILIQAPEASLETGFEIQITGPGSYLLPDGGSLAVEPVDTVRFPAEPDTACFDVAKTPFPWLVRTFRPGDRMMPFGMSGRKKIKDIFVDRKIPLSTRKNISLLWQGDDLLWVVGVCFSELCRIDPLSAVPVQVTWHKRNRVNPYATGINSNLYAPLSE